MGFAKQVSGTMPSVQNYDAIIIGAGFSGLYMLHRLRGLGMSARVYERGSGVGGTWYWNRYPGARCDVESVQYSYSFSDALQQEWQWTERYAGQAEILRYANHVADRFDLRRDIELNTNVISAEFDEADNRWTVTLEGGKRVTAQHLVMAVGCLSNARMPDIPGLASFRGKVFHTGEWPHEGVDFTGLRVGVVGTGSSAIQSIPVIAEEAKHVTVFQRTPNYSIPARNYPLSEDEKRAWAENYREFRRRAREEMRNGIVSEIPQKGALEESDDEREATYDFRWARGGLTFMTAYNNLALDKAANDTAADFVRRKIGETVKDPAVAKLLQPTTYPIGTKRICIDTDYFETFNRDNVTLVDIRNAPISEITPNGIVTGGKEYECDAIVFATGFDAMTGSFARIDIRGRDGLTLKRQVGRGAEDLSRPDGRGLSQHVPGHRTGQPVGAVEHDRVDRAARRLDFRLPRLSARAAMSRASRRRKVRKTAGSRTSMRWRTTRSIRRRTPGTWARTFPASRACSCPTSAAFRPIGRSATRSRRTAIAVSR